jgi:hypothetical protein
LDQLHLTIASRLSPPVATWMVVAVLGLLANYLTLRIIRHRLRAPMAKHTAIRAMLVQNSIAEITRGLSQLIALLTGAGFVAGVLQGDAVAWALVLMNATKVTNSVNEYLAARQAGTVEENRRRRIERILLRRRARRR